MDTTLTAGRQHQLDLLLELGQKKAGLGIEMVYFNDVDKEKAFIAEQKKPTDPAEIDTLLGMYTDARFHVLESYLHSVNDSTLIKISTADSRDPKNVGSLPVFQVVYSIQ
jgi:hypothetical protein